MRKIHKIYRITNLITNRSYIGQTQKKIHLRWSNHKSPASNCGYISRSIKKHGSENFKIEWIASAISEDYIDQLEDFFIRIENTISPNGYNLKYGGSHPQTSDEHKQIMSEAHIKRYENVTPEEMERITRGLKEYTTKKRRSLTAVNPKTNEIKTFETVNQAISCGYSTRAIYDSLDPNKLGTSKGFHFFYTDNNTIDEMFELAQKQHEAIKQSHIDSRKKAVESAQDYFKSKHVPYIGIDPKTLKYKIFESSTEAVQSGYNTDAMRRGNRGEKRTTKGLHFQKLTLSPEEHIEITRKIFG